MSIFDEDLEEFDLDKFDLDNFITVSESVLYNEDEIFF